MLVHRVALGDPPGRPRERHRSQDRGDLGRPRTTPIVPQRRPQSAEEAQSFQPSSGGLPKAAAIKWFARRGISQLRPSSATKYSGAQGMVSRRTHGRADRVLLPVFARWRLVGECGNTGR